MPNINSSPNQPVTGPVERCLAAIEYRPIESFEDYQCIARHHPDEQIARLAASIAEFGFSLPVLVDADDRIMAGHVRIEAARRAGLREVPIFVAAHWTAIQVCAYRVADSQLTQLADWDEEIVAIEETALLELAYPCADVAEAVRGQTEPVARLGDRWRLGSYEISCGPFAADDQSDPAELDHETIGFLRCVDDALIGWAILTGREALLAGDWETFRAVAARRACEGWDRSSASSD